ncbi:3-phosphoshikimate 1-carboxyvinyltransferase [Apilactobacillus sp. M161]|uniref:3-phosphoshikimate 1-carboxyvinyltransferase n=1 Tax=Apilactobacillus xinyiensis TaxID=2841032 RepID=A0ABT0I273_9LACO|nr:3-phosphoshikimate 1-carboxyvinyltransferase [Apilactobacillus xinyiensis]MCK8624821.1 3-phosphoshikimate 1-carboxyvinyltransferase [Apilactobacillus xinyiensis]
MMTGVNGTLLVPGDKSISHRSIILGAMCQGQTTIDNFLDSADCNTTIEAFKAMGVAIQKNAHQVIINSTGKLKAPTKPLNMGNSGTTTRLMMGLLSAQPFDTQLVGDASLSKRPMRRVAQPLQQMGAKINTSVNGTLPVKITGKQLHGMEYTMPVASAQVKSAIMLAALKANDNTAITEPTPSRDHTERMLKMFSPDSIEKHAQLIQIKPNCKMIPQHLTVPGDISSAAFWIVAATILPNSHITLKKVGINPTRMGLVNVMKRMGADISIINQSNTAEPIADIVVKSASLQPVALDAKEVPALIDEAPLLALLAARANGVSKLQHLSELRFKESDRIRVIVQEFQKMGIAIKELSDGFEIDGSKAWRLQSNQLDSHQDHRIAMTLKIASQFFDTEIGIKDADCVNISYPTFFNDLKQLRS